MILVVNKLYHKEYVIFVHPSTYFISRNNSKCLLYKHINDRYKYKTIREAIQTVKKYYKVIKKSRSIYQGNCLFFNVESK